MSGFAAAQERYLRVQDLIDTGVVSSRATLYRHLDAGLFPRPIRFPGRRIAWRQSVIEAWVRQQELGE